MFQWQRVEDLMAASWLCPVAHRPRALDFPKDSKVARLPQAAPAPCVCSGHTRRRRHRGPLTIGLPPLASPHFLSAPCTLSTCPV